MWPYRYLCTYYHHHHHHIICTLIFPPHHYAMPPSSSSPKLFNDLVRCYHHIISWSSLPPYWLWGVLFILPLFLFIHPTTQTAQDIFIAFLPSMFPVCVCIFTTFTRLGWMSILMRWWWWLWWWCRWKCNVISIILRTM